MKTYVAIVRDHSASMRSLAHNALKDYNLLLDGLKAEKQDIIVSVVECGVGPLAKVVTKEIHKPVNTMQQLSSYQADGSGTPLWDSVGVAIKELEMRIPYEEDSTAFLVMVITDGAENRSSLWSSRAIADKIRELQNSDRWTFAFRVPVGYKNQLIHLGIPSGNIMEWEQTTQAFEKATTVNTQSINTYFAARSAGTRSVSSFYDVNLSNISSRDVNKNLVDVSSKYNIHTVPYHQDGIAIKDFCTQLKYNYSLGKAYYQLVKREEIQNGKLIMVRDRVTGHVYAGDSARSLLGLPDGAIKVNPSGHGNYDVFVQSTSVNRKLPANSLLLYPKK